MVYPSFLILSFVKQFAKSLKNETKTLRLIFSVIHLGRLLLFEAFLPRRPWKVIRSQWSSKSALEFDSSQSDKILRSHKKIDPTYRCSGRKGRYDVSSPKKNDDFAWFYALFDFVSHHSHPQFVSLFYTRIKIHIL